MTSRVLNGVFAGAAKPLDTFDIPKLAHRLNVPEAAMRALVKVESSGRPFDSAGRPAMLFEPHVFYRNIKDVAKRNAAVKLGLAYAKWVPGKYPKDSYPRLSAAMEIDARAALMACSIGASQVLVENYATLGFQSPEDMWEAWMDDAEEHIEGMLKFVLANGIDDDMRAGRWDVVARVYNGPKYAVHGYHTKLAAAAREAARSPSAWAPDAPDSDFDPRSITPDSLKSVQTRLIELGYPEVGRADGKWGSKTRAAVLAFRADRGLPTVAGIDEAFLAELMLAGHREIAPERANATAADLKAAGSRKIAAADQAQKAGFAALAGGGFAAMVEVKDHLTILREVLGDAQTVAGRDGVLPWLIVAGIGAFVVYQQIQIKRATVEDYREGKYVGR